MADEIAIRKTGRHLGDVVRYILGISVGIVVLLVLYGRRTEFVAAWHQLSHVAVGWIAAAVTAEAASLWTYAYLQQRVLRLGGASIAMPGLFLLTLANDGIANTVPGEPAVSSAYRYRYYRRHGTSGASAGWTIFTILIAQAIGMSSLLLLGVVVALAAGTASQDTGAAAIGLVIVLVAGAILVRRDLVLRLAGALVRVLRRVTGHPRGSIGARIESTLARMREIPLSRRSTAGIVALAAAVWFCDFLCLLCAFGAVHAAIPWAGVLLAYGVAQVAGTLPIVPGGIGIIEGSLAVILVGYGTGHASALSAALVFRIVSFWLAIAVGWISVAVIARHARRPSGAEAETERASEPGADAEPESAAEAAGAPGQ